MATFYPPSTVCITHNLATGSSFDETIVSLTGRLTQGLWPQVTESRPASSLAGISFMFQPLDLPRSKVSYGFWISNRKRV
jgi:hypothetical protein